MRTSPALVLALLITPASSAIVYSGLWDIPIPLNFEGVYLDIDTGATAAFEMSGWDVNFFFGGVGIAGSADFQPGRSGTGNEDPIQRIAAGFVISPPSPALPSLTAEAESGDTAVMVTTAPRYEGNSGAGTSPDDDPLALTERAAESRPGGGGRPQEDGGGSRVSSDENAVTLMTLQYSTGQTGSYTHLGAPGNFQDGEEGYFGFRFTANDGSGFYYGWMRVTLTANTSGAIIHDWAWENSGGSIAAGQVPEPGSAALLTGLAAATLLRRRRACPDRPAAPSRFLTKYRR